jgi:hypothetical protein
MIMRKLILLLPVTIVCLLLSCSKDERNSLSQGFIPAGQTFAVNNTAVFTVPPSGGDDTDELLQAFAEAQAAGPGSVVQLVEGTYIISSVEINDFVGSFKGKGKEKTIVLAAPDLPCKESFDYATGKNTFSHLLKFVGGDVVISDMTLKIPEGFACATETDYGGRDLMTILTLADYSDGYRPETYYIKALVENVKFIGGSDDGSGAAGQYNTSIGVWAAGDWWYYLEGKDYPFSKMNITIRNSEFDNLLGACEVANMGSEGVSDFSNNYCHDLMMGFFSGFNYGANLSFKNNKFVNNTWIDLWLDDDDWGTSMYFERTKRTLYEVSGNTFSPANGGIAISLLDWKITVYPEMNLPPMLLNISNNLFNLKPDCIGILAQNNKDATIRNNRFTGSCNTGILVEGIPITDWSGAEHPAVFANNILMLGNNMSGLNSSVANILMAETTENCTVVGGSNSGTVINNGVDNKVTGAIRKNVPLKVGPSIRDNFKISRIK